MPEEYALNFYHLGILFCLDVDKDGRFSLADVLFFADMCLERVKLYKPHEITSQL